MAVLCLLTNTPWPRPTPAGAASASGGFPPRSATEGERSEGLHKRSAEDEGAACARQGRSPSGRSGFLAWSSLREQKRSLLRCCWSHAKREGHAEIGPEQGAGHQGFVDVRLLLTHSAEMRFALMLLLILTLVGQTVAAQPVSRFLQTHYKAADGSWVRRPRIYKRGPRTDVPTATCRDGSLSFAHSRTGQCSHHGGIRP